jgi:hypothetical protein
VDLLAHRLLPWYGALRSPDPEPSPTDLVDAGSRASDTPRLWRRGRGTHLTDKLMASGDCGLPGKPMGVYEQGQPGNLELRYKADKSHARAIAREVR